MRFSKVKLAVAIGALMIGSQAMADIKIAVLGPFTNNTSTDLGISVKEGAALAAAEINANGGVLGQKIVLVPYDDKAKVELGTETAKKAVQDKVVAGIGSVNTGVTVKAIPIFQQANIPYIVSGQTGAGTGKTFSKEPVNYIFRNTLHDEVQAPALIKRIVDENKYTKVAIFADKSGYGDGGVALLTKELEARKLKPVAVERFDVGTYSFEENVENARAAGADAVVVWSLSSESAALRIDINRVGWVVPFYGSYTVATRLYENNAGFFSYDTNMPVSVTLDADNKTVMRFVENYKRMHRRYAVPSLMHAAQTYDSMYLLAMAIQQANSTDSKKIVQALENLNGTYEGVVTTYKNPWSSSEHEMIGIGNLAKIGRYDQNYNIVTAKKIK